MSGAVDGHKDHTLPSIITEEPQEDDHVVGESHGTCFGVYPF